MLSLFLTADMVCLSTANARGPTLNGYELIKLNVEATDWVIKALWATGRMYQRTHSLVQTYPQLLEGDIWSMFFSLPKTTAMLKDWSTRAHGNNNKPLTADELKNRIAICAHIVAEDQVIQDKFTRYLARAAADGAGPTPAPPPQ